jgi:hypothetical protein
VSWEGYLTFAGVELVNHDRLFEYMRQGLRSSSAVINDCGCETLTPLFDDPGPYTLPAADNAPWYDPNIPESATFAGVFVTDIDGLESPWLNRRPVQSPVHGGLLPPLRAQARILTFRGYLFGRTRGSIDYGLDWLSRTLAGQHCDQKGLIDCTTGDLGFFGSCPVDLSDSGCDPGLAVDETAGNLERLRHRMCRVGLMRGPNERKYLRMGSGCVGVEVQWQMAAEVPWIYGLSEEVCVNQNLNLGPFDTVYHCCDDIGQLDNPCDDDAPPMELLQGCYCEPFGVRMGTCEVDNPSPYRQLALGIRIRNNNVGSAATNIRIAVYEKDLNEPCPQTLADITDDDWCNRRASTIEIASLPPESELTIDATCRESQITGETPGGTVIQDGNRWFTAESGGAFDYPVLGPCSRYCVVVTLDCDSPSQNVRFDVIATEVLASVGA